MRSASATRRAPTASPTELVDAAVRVAGRLSDPERVAEAVRADLADGAPPWFWRAHGTAAGFSGLALLFGCLDRSLPDAGWDRVAHRHLTAAVDSAQQLGALPLGSAEGASGLAFTALLLDRDGRRYRRLRRTLDQYLADRLSDLLAERRGTALLPAADLDVISGAAGISSYLVSRPETDALSELGVELREQLARCVAEGRFPLRPAGGAADCGLAHGLPGVLAALAVAHLSGAATTGTAAALRSGADRMWAHRLTDAWGPNWPVDDASPDPAHAAWCYGAPGVARSLLLAGRALGDPVLRADALRAITAVRQRPDPVRRLVSPGFCHGTAGLAHLLRCTGLESGRADLSAEARRLLSDLVASFDPDTRFGYRCPGADPSVADAPGLLDGAAGVAAVLLSAAGRPIPAWDRLFLVR
ncbi:lanthionine synthetase C family protein [Kitasatospora sp. NBC_00070]|uniref:lanthionine synthetase C family protein n=1 Tax=Kitasatospora sp. NBC_00070 TaxID=2975962 RepID=UPI00324A7F7C